MRFAVVVDTRDVRVGDGGCRARFAQESRAKLRIVRPRGRELDRDAPGKMGVLSHIDDAHTTLSQLAENPVMGDRLSNHGLRGSPHSLSKGARIQLARWDPTRYDDGGGAMREFYVEVDIDAPPDIVWAIMRDVEHLLEWTPTVTSIRLSGGGPLRVESRAIVRQPKLPPAQWRVTELGERSFTWVSWCAGRSRDRATWRRCARHGKPGEALTAVYRTIRRSCSRISREE